VIKQYLREMESEIQKAQDALSKQFLLKRNMNLWSRKQTKSSKKERVRQHLQLIAVKKKWQK
jgi:hypothetical protein